MSQTPHPRCFTTGQSWVNIYAGLMYPITRRGEPTTKLASRVAALKRILKNAPWDNNGRPNGLRYYQLVVRDGKEVKRTFRSAIDHELCKLKMQGKYGFPEPLVQRIVLEMGKGMVLSALPANA